MPIRPLQEPPEHRAPLQPLADPPVVYLCVPLPGAVAWGAGAQQPWVSRERGKSCAVHLPCRKPGGEKAVPAPGEASRTTAGLPARALLRGRLFPPCRGDAALMVVGTWTQPQMMVHCVLVVGPSNGRV